MIEEFAGAAPRLHVVNALTDEEHPCQALADLMTLREHFGTLEAGPSPTSATATTSQRRWRTRRDVRMRVHVASPLGYELPGRVRADQPRRPEWRQLQPVHRSARSRAGADAVYTDVWTSMGQEDEASNGWRTLPVIRSTNA